MTTFLKTWHFKHTTWQLPPRRACIPCLLMAQGRLPGMLLLQQLAYAALGLGRVPPALLHLLRTIPDSLFALCQKVQSSGGTHTLADKSVTPAINAWY